MRSLPCRRCAPSHCQREGPNQSRQLLGCVASGKRQPAPGLAWQLHRQHRGEPGQVHCVPRIIRIFNAGTTRGPAGRTQCAA